MIYWGKGQETNRRNNYWYVVVVGVDTDGWRSPKDIYTSLLRLWRFALLKVFLINLIYGCEVSIANIWMVF